MGSRSPFGADQIATAPTDAGASFALATIEGGSQLGANPSFGVAGPSFQPQPNPSLPDIGGDVRIARGTNRVEVAGQARFTLAGNPVSVTVGQYDPANPAKFVAGAAFEAASLKSLDVVVKTAGTLGGLTFSADNLRGTYDAAGAKFTVSGDTRSALAGSGVAVRLGGGATPVLVVVGGRVTSADFTVASAIRVGGVGFKAANLAATYTEATSTYALRGGASFDLKESTVGVTFGGKSTAGLVVTNGTVTSADFAVDAKITVGGLAFAAADLRATYATTNNGTYILKGAAAFDLKGSAVAVTFGDSKTVGLAIANGVVQSFDFSVNSKVVAGGLAVTSKDLRAAFTDSDSTYTLNGTATATITGLGTLALTLGAANKPGLVIQNGSLVSLFMRINSNFTFLKYTFTVENLDLSYSAATETFTARGRASVDLF